MFNQKSITCLIRSQVAVKRVKSREKNLQISLFGPFHQYENLNITLLKMQHATIQNWPVGGHIFEKLNSLSFPGHLKIFPSTLLKKGN